MAKNADENFKRPSVEEYKTQLGGANTPKINSVNSFADALPVILKHNKATRRLLIDNGMQDPRIKNVLAVLHHLKHGTGIGAYITPANLNAIKYFVRKNKLVTRIKKLKVIDHPATRLTPNRKVPEDAPKIKQAGKAGWQNKRFRRRR
jgi:hypothetical protein